MSYRAAALFVPTLTAYNLGATEPGGTAVWNDMVVEETPSLTFVLILVLCGPAAFALAFARSPLARHSTLAAAVWFVAGTALPTLLFIGTRQSDAIDNAAAYIVCPAFGVWGLLSAGVTLLAFRRK